MPDSHPNGADVLLQQLESQASTLRALRAGCAVIHADEDPMRPRAAYWAYPTTHAVPGNLALNLDALATNLATQSTARRLADKPSVDSPNPCPRRPHRPRLMPTPRTATPDSPQTSWRIRIVTTRRGVSGWPSAR